MKSGRRTWADGTLVAGQQFEYGFDDIGNRSSAKTGGDALGANLRSQGYTVNDLNLYTARTNPRYLEVQGAAQTTATVQVDGSTSGVLRQGEYFRRELGSIAGTGPVWQTVAVGLSGGTNTGTKRLFLPPATESYTHDADGNLTQDGQWDYGWDAENRLVAMSSVLDPGTSLPLNTTLARRITWQYDGLGRVLERTEYAWSVVDAWWAATPMAITRYLYDGWDCVAEFSVSGGTVTHQRSYVWGLDLSGSRTGAGGVGGLVTIYQAPMSSPTAHFAAYDGNGNVIGLVKASDGTLSARYEYGPFGEALRATGDAIASANPWRFSTKRTDPVTALVHYEYRVYQPTTGRWLSRDPMEEEGGLNVLSFVNNSTVLHFDVLGLKLSEECVKLLGEIKRFAVGLKHEYDKYNPFTDAIGGFPRGGKVTIIGGIEVPPRTKPGGHYREIRNWQQGLVRLMNKFFKNCLKDCDDDDDPGNRISAEVSELAKLEVTVPPGIQHIPVPPLHNTNPFRRPATYCNCTARTITPPMRMPSEYVDALGVFAGIVYAGVVYEIAPPISLPGPVKIPIPAYP